MSQRSAFSILEIVVVFTIIGVMAGVGALRLEHGRAQLAKDNEGQRLLAILRSMREMASSGGPDAGFGYGVFFWYNSAAGCCYEYSPYIPRSPTVPNGFGNYISRFANMGLPDQPFALGLRSPVERQGLSGSARSEGFRIYFQTDTLNQPDFVPSAQRTYDGGGNPITPSPVNSWRDSMYLFWPRGQRPNNGGPWAPAFWTPCSGAQYGVTMPTRGGCNNVWYNRIYIRSDTDTTNNPISDPNEEIPARIWIHPGTGIVRLMEKYERRADGRW